MIVLRPRAIRHKFRLGTGFTAAFLARQVPTSGRRKTAAKTDSRGWTPSRHPLRYRSQAINMNAGRSLQVAGRHGPADHKNTRPTALCVGAVRNGGPLRDSITAHSDIMVGFYEPRTTNCELRLFPRIQMRLCRVRFMIVLRPRAIRHKFRLGTGFTAAFLARQVPTSGRRKTAAKTDSHGWTPSRRPLRYRIQAMS